MKYRIRALGKYQKAVLAVAVLLVLVFSVLYPVTMGREGYLYRGGAPHPRPGGGRHRLHGDDQRGAGPVHRGPGQCGGLPVRGDHLRPLHRR